MGSASKSLALAIVALFLVSLVSVSLAFAQNDVAWSVETVDENGAALGGNCPIAVDSNNTAHIAYTALINGTYFIMYASSNGSGWSTQTIDRGFEAYSLLLDVNGNQHVLYGNLHGTGYPVGLVNPLKIATWNGRNWNIQDTGISEAGYATLALDSSGNPHIAYIGGDAVKYAKQTGTNWAIQTVDTLSDSGGLSLALDSNNNPYILYSPSSYADYSQAIGIRAINVKLATYQNSSWNIQTVPLPPPTGDLGNLVVDSKNVLHFICTQHHFVSSENKTTLSTILYASWDGTAWNTDTVVSNTYFNSISSLALDSHDYPHIFYIIPAPEGFIKTIYASWTGNAWNIVDSNISAASGPCYLALDANGNPHISYHVSIGNRYIAPLMYATTTETTLSPTTSTSTAPVSTTIVTIAIVAIVSVALATVLLYRRHRRPVN